MSGNDSGYQSDSPNSRRSSAASSSSMTGAPSTQGRRTSRSSSIAGRRSSRSRSSMAGPMTSTPQSTASRVGQGRRRRPGRPVGSRTTGRSVGRAPMRTGPRPGTTSRSRSTSGVSHRSSSYRARSTTGGRRRPGRPVGSRTTGRSVGRAPMRTGPRPGTRQRGRVGTNQYTRRNRGSSAVSRASHRSQASHSGSRY